MEQEKIDIVPSFDQICLLYDFFYNIDMKNKIIKNKKPEKIFWLL